MMRRPPVNKPRRLNINREEGLNSYKLSKMVADLRCLDGIGKAVLRAMADRYPNIWAAVPSLAAEAGFSETATRNRLRMLERTGYISPLGDRRGGRNNTEQYILHVHFIRTVLETQRLETVLEQENSPSNELNPTPDVALTQRETLPLTPKPNATRAETQRQTLGNREVNRESKENREEQHHQPLPGNFDAAALDDRALPLDTKILGQVSDSDAKRARLLTEQARLFRHAGESTNATNAHLDRSWQVAQANGINVYLGG
jgi:hypothetical protein